MTVAYFTPRAWVKRVCCVSKISSDCGCQSKEIGVGMEVRLLSVGTRGFFLAASRLAIAASPLNSVAPNEKKPLAPGYLSLLATKMNSTNVESERYSDYRNPMPDISNNNFSKKLKPDNMIGTLG